MGKQNNLFCFDQGNPINLHGIPLVFTSVLASDVGFVVRWLTETVCFLYESQQNCRSHLLPTKSGLQPSKTRPKLPIKTRVMFLGSRYIGNFGI